MCILFVQTNDNVSSTRPYKLILAINRDEQYARPSAPAHFWDGQEDIIGGRDLHPGKEGGTWFAMNTNGKFGVLLNVLVNPGEMNPNLPGRGVLVNNYLTSPLNGSEFLTYLAESDVERNPYAMIAGEYNDKGSFEMNYYNTTLESPIHIDEEINSFSNNANLSKPFRKAAEGKNIFKHILDNQSMFSKDQLVERLIQMLRTNIRFHPDDNMKLLGSHIQDFFLEAGSSIFVEIPHLSYGTRTHTVVLVDGNNHVDYIEYTMKRPLNFLGHYEKDQTSWIVSKFQFDLSVPKHSFGSFLHQ